MSEIQEKFNQAIQDLDVELVKKLIKDPKIDVLAEASKSVVTMELMEGVVNRSEEEKDVKRRAPIKDILEIFQSNSNVVLLDKIEEFSMEELEDFLSKDDLSHLSFTLFTTLLEKGLVDKINLLLASKYNKLEEETVSQISATVSIIDSTVIADTTALSQGLELDYLTDNLKKYFEADRTLNEDVLVLLVEKELLSIKAILVGIVHKSLDDFIGTYEKYQHLVDEELVNDLLEEAVKNNKEFLYDYLSTMEVLKNIREDVAIQVLRIDREKWLAKVVTDPRFRYDKEQIATYSRSQKEFDIFMKLPDVLAYVEDNKSLFRKGNFLENYKKNSTVRNKFADF